MSKRFKKVALAIYLDPHQSVSDRYTYDILMDWSNKRKEYAADPSATIELHQLVHIHKDIYLSGLFLHTLKPELAKSLALSLAMDSINNSVLQKVLKSHNVLEDEDNKNNLEPQQLVQLISQSMQEQLSQLVTEPDAEPLSKQDIGDIVADYHERQEQHITQQLAQQEQTLMQGLAQQFTDLEPNVSSGSSNEHYFEQYQQQIDEVKQLINQQTQQLPNTVSEVLDEQLGHLKGEDTLSALAEPSSTLSKQDVDAIAGRYHREYKQQIAELKQLISQQSQLIRQLSKGQAIPTSNTVTMDGVTADSPEQVEERLARVKKMKKKGVF